MGGKAQRQRACTTLENAVLICVLAQLHLCLHSCTCWHLYTFALRNPCPSCAPPKTGITVFYNKDTEAGRTEPVAKTRSLDRDLLLYPPNPEAC